MLMMILSFSLKTRTFYVLLLIRHIWVYKIKASNQFYIFDEINVLSFIKLFVFTRNIYCLNHGNSEITIFIDKFHKFLFSLFLLKRKIYHIYWFIDIWLPPTFIGRIWTDLSFLSRSPGFKKYFFKSAKQLQKARKVYTCLQFAH